MSISITRVFFFSLLKKELSVWLNGSLHAAAYALTIIFDASRWRQNTATASSVLSGEKNISC